MGSSKEKGPRHVALALIFSPSTHRLLMITSRKHPNLWILPKGGVEHGESSGQAAVRESWEEAGTPKTLNAPTDDDRLLMLALEPAAGGRAQVWHIHVIKVEEREVEQVTDWPEAGERQRSWVTPTECQERIRAWYKDQSAQAEVTPGVEVEGDIEGGKKQRKKDRKGGAMELALKAFTDIYGWEGS